MKVNHILIIYRLFIKIRCYLAGHSASVPLTFAMSFYVGLVVKRWWEQYRLLPWPDTLALFASAAIPGTTVSIQNKNKFNTLFVRAQYSVH